ncbi:MAG: tetratricopeptide repeat protein [Chitinophagaceae bacterium]|nr:MAG: tetratricopeptide repeat protein [Chitinophagaceae bacterium]
MSKYFLLSFVISSSALSAVAQSDSAAVYLQKGKEEQTARRFREAEKNFLKADQFNPNQPEILNSLASAYHAQNRYNEERVTLTKADVAAPNNQDVIFQLAELSLALRQWPDAVKYSQKLQQLKSEKPVSYIIAKSLYEQENYGESLKYCEKAFKEEPKRAEIPYIAARCFVEMSNYKRAAGCYEQALGLDSTRVPWMYEAGLTYYAVPDDKKAIEWFEKAGAKGHPRSNDWLENIGNANLNAGNYAKGLEYLREVLAKKPNDQELIYNIADALYRNGKYKEAIEYWDQILAIDKSNARALYMIGMAYQKGGDTAKGTQLCDKAIAMDPSLKSLKTEKKM